MFNGHGRLNPALAELLHESILVWGQLNDGEILTTAV